MSLIVIGLVTVFLFLFFLWQARPSRKAEAEKRQEQALREIATGTPSVKPRQPVTRELSTQDLFQKAAPSVVLIEVFDDEGHKRGQGSGFIAARDGSVVTNYHVIRGAHRAVAHFADGASGQVAGVTGYDRDRDVAVLKVAGRVPAPLPLGNSDTVQTGQKVVAIGSPLGFQNTVTEGIVSGVRLGLIQMSVPISPGSSGGPVLDTRGEVVGIAVASIVQGQNLNFAVPAKWAQNYIGAGAPRSLAEIAAENTVIQRILDGTISIPAGDRKAWEINVNSNLMSSPEIRGTFEARGGLTGNIRLVLLYGQHVLYDSGRTTRGEIHKGLSQDGAYTLVVDNSESMLMSREVTAQIVLRYVQ